MSVDASSDCQQLLCAPRDCRIDALISRALSLFSSLACQFSPNRRGEYTSAWNPDEFSAKTPHAASTRSIVFRLSASDASLVFQACNECDKRAMHGILNEVYERRLRCDSSCQKEMFI